MKKFLRFGLSSLRILVDPSVGRSGSFIGAMVNRVGVWGPLLFVHLALVWTVGSAFGLPRLIWRVVEDPFASFLGAVSIGLLLGLGIFLFFVLDYSEWLGERRSFRALVRSKLDTQQHNEINNGPSHWTNRLYAEFKAERHLLPNLDIRAMAEFQGYAFNRLFTMVVLVWCALWMLQPLVFHCFHIPQAHQIACDSGPACQRDWWLVPLGFAIGVGWVYILGWLNQRAHAHWPWLRRRSQHLSVYLHKGRPEQAIESGELYDESPLMAFFILCSAVVLTIHLCFVLLDGVGSPVLFPVVALCILMAEWMLVYAGLCLLFRQKGAETWAVASVILVILIQWINGGFVETVRALLHGRFLALVTFATWLLPIAAYLIWRKKGLEVWFLAGALLLLGLLPYTGQRYLFRTLEESHPAKTFQELAEIDCPPPRSADESPVPGLYLDAPASPPAWSVQERRPLVVFCASGGGITAEVWAYTMLEGLDHHIPGFTQDLRIITGASGGMVGAAAWVSNRFYHRIPIAFSGDKLDQLSRVTQRMALWDFSWGAVLQRVPVWPFTLTKYHDRGNLLENVWREGFPSLEVALPALLPDERSGELPSLVFSPMLAQDGRRLLISNLDLSPLKHAGWGSGTRLDRVRCSIQADADTMAGIPLTTWARMNATFPIVSPAASLPQRHRIDSPRNPVDAGYYDNDGTNLAVGWIRECYLPWLEVQRQAKNPIVQPPSCIVLVELDAYPRLPTSAKSSRLAGNLFFEDFKSVATGAQQRVRSTHFRNDEEVEALGRFEQEHDGLRRIPVHSVRFECAARTSISWTLTQLERDAILTAARECFQSGEFGRLKELFD